MTFWDMSEEAENVQICPRHSVPWDTRSSEADLWIVKAYREIELFHAELQWPDAGRTGVRGNQGRSPVDRLDYWSGVGLSLCRSVYWGRRWR